MPPDAFMFDTSGQLVMQTAIGGAGTLFGPLVGAAVWLYLSDFFQTTLHLGATWKLVLGVVFVLLVCFLRRGIDRRHRRSVCASRPARRETAEPDETRRHHADRGGEQQAAEAAARAPDAVAMPARQRATDRSSGPILQATGLTKHYGGLARQQRHRFHRQSRRAARHHRAERRRQDHLLQDADLRGAADRRARSCSRAATSPA